MDEKELLEAIGKMLAPIHSDIRTIKEDVDALKADNAKLITIEKSVHLLLEGQQGINEKFKMLDQVAEDVEEIKIKVNALESATKDNTSQIRELRAIK